MKEDFLQYLWRMARFDLVDLQTTEGQSIAVQDFGVHNTDAGPDFEAARLRIDGVQWAGRVEIHVKSSEWYDHGHDRDPAYDNVILHVVLQEDRPVWRRDGSRIPCLELRGRIPPGIFQTYWRLVHNEYWVACQNQHHLVTDTVKNMWLQRLLAERLPARAARFEARLSANERDWEEAFYQAVARALGGSVNGEAMDNLARSLPLRIILKHKNSLLQLEALLFGQSGLLPPEAVDEEAYLSQLRREYTLLRTKHGLRPIPVASWRFLRLRPNNFPTVRIAQLATLLYRSGQLFGKALAASGTKELENMFEVSLSNYWRDHYRFGVTCRRSKRRLGDTTVQSILINAVGPAYYAYGKLRADPRFKERALDLLNELPPENNAIVRRWRKLGWSPISAAESQALLELKENYCKVSRCTACAIGCAILKRGGERRGDAPLLTLNEEAQAYRLAS